MEWIGAILWMAVLGLISLGTLLAKRHFRKSPKHLDAPFTLLPVSILKPLKGNDPNLRQNLESFFLLNYPSFEILFSIPCPRDPARAVVEELQLQYPNVLSRLFIGAKEIGHNPKINNLITSYNEAQFDFVLISDSNVFAPTDMLKRLMAQVETGVGIITSVIAGTDGSGLGGQLESTQLNTFYARGMLLAEYFGKPCVVGKSMLFQRSVAKRFGGLETLSNYIAEDQMAGEAMKKLGLKIHTNVDPVIQVIGTWSFKEFWKRHLRWGRLRKMHSPLTFYVEPLTQFWVIGLIGCLSLQNVLSPALFFTLHFGIWGLNDFFLLKAIHRKSNTRMSVFSPFYWIIRETLAVPLWIHIAMGDRVEWRGHQIQLGIGGIILNEMTIEVAVKR